MLVKAKLHRKITQLHIILLRKIFRSSRFYLVSVFPLVKVDLHSANFSRANDTFRWRLLSFQSPFEANEIWIFCKAKSFKQNANHNKSAKTATRYVL